MRPPDAPLLSPLDAGARTKDVVRLLLISPKFPESFWSFRWAVDRVLPRKRSVNPPLGLATLAALCPAHWQVTIVDENVGVAPADPAADIIGVCGMGVQFKRQRELLAYYKARGCFVVAGGSYASLCPEQLAGDADAVIAGEAEYVWPQFCRDYEMGQVKALYRETGSVNLADSPTPRFDLLDLSQYTTATLQFSRGCPYRCEFCDIIVMFGRKPRCKSVAQVERELDALRAAGASNAFFVDDNLIGNRPVAKQLLRGLVAYQQRNGYPFRFGTEVSINVAQDAELLQLLREARFEWVFIGIESSDPATLKEARKQQNTHEDALTSLRRIYSHGIDVLGGFIVGFDNDTLETFESQYQFIVASGIQAAMVGLLMALPRTPLYARLASEGRLRADVDGSDNTKPATNVTPRHMRYEQMVSAFQRLHVRLSSDHAIARRIHNKVRHMGDPLYAGEYGLREQLGIVGRLVFRGILPGGPRRIYHFLRSLPVLSPRKLPLVVVDWIAGLAMRDYVDRHFAAPDDPDQTALAQRLRALRRAIAKPLREGRVVVSMRQALRAEVCVAFKPTMDRALVKQTGLQLSRLLSRTPSRLTLDLRSLLHGHEGQIAYLLQQLARYGDRVSIVAAETLRGRGALKWPHFNWVLPAMAVGTPCSRLTTAR